MRIQLMTPRKLPFIIIKLPFFISESYRFGFMLKINGNFDTERVTVYRYKESVFCRKVTVSTRMLPLWWESPFVQVESYRFVGKLPLYQRVTVFRQEVTVFV